MSKSIEEQLQIIAKNSQAVFEKIENDYATKEEVGEIDTALDKIIEIQNSFLLPSAEETTF